jgi:hypothetical protein
MTGLRFVLLGLTIVIPSLVTSSDLPPSISSWRQDRHTTRAVKTHHAGNECPLIELVRSK